jgi:hypothetical protein
LETLSLHLSQAWGERGSGHPPLLDLKHLIMPLPLLLCNSNPINRECNIHQEVVQEEDHLSNLLDLLLEDHLFKALWQLLLLLSSLELLLNFLDLGSSLQVEQQQGMQTSDHLDLLLLDPLLFLLRLLMQFLQVQDETMAHLLVQHSDLHPHQTCYEDHQALLQVSNLLQNRLSLS